MITTPKPLNLKWFVQLIRAENYNTHKWSNISRTPDRDFRCFYPCESILSYISIPLAARWPQFDQWRHCNVKITSPCRISAYPGNFGSLFHVFQYKMRYLSVSKKKNPLFCEDWIEKSVLVMPIGDPGDRFFYPTLTLMMGSYLSRVMAFPTMWYVRPAKPQISLRICTVCSEPLLVAWMFYEC